MSTTIVISTRRKRQVIDLTDRLHEVLGAATTQSGLCHLFLTHTTAALTTADLDPGTDLDMLDAFEGMIPKLDYRHPHNPAHVPDHIMSSLIGPSLLVPFADRQLTLGTWQRVVLIELDGPRERSVKVTVLPPA